ncbi:Flavanone 3-dioxygenase protein [Dioscorea alata]|uniref:Flavanone 3-dioxygenase protein n=1 Tax=Dioscorea alata TaxID=55571 RepID=A0ACB7TZM0_DIOAL|nr:Flavanone 3-dioxygenase protein [Dioscorea alata]
MSNKLDCMGMCSEFSKMVLLSDIVRRETSGCIPSSYVRPKNERPNLLDMESSDVSIPLINLHEMDDHQHSLVVKAIGEACKSDGFFMVKNHGIPETVLSEMLRISKEYFKLPECERMKAYSDDPKKTMRLSTSCNVKIEKVASWRDYLRLHCYPLKDFIHQWPSNPHSFQEIVGEYCKRVRELALKLLEAISESLGMEKKYMEKALGKQGQHMAINYYPPCPQPELTFGLPGHNDPNAITILLQDTVPGLQILRNGKWLAVNPLPNTLIINIGNQIEVLSNGRYKSVLHRAIVNKDNERISVATFYCPSYDAVMEPARELVDEEHPRITKAFTYGEYYDQFWNLDLQSESCLDLFKV